MRQPDELQQFVHAIFQASATEPAEPAKETQRFLAAKIFVEVGILRQKTDCFPAFNKTAVTTENFGATARWRNEAKNNFQSSALARAIWTEQPVNFAWFDAKIEIADRDYRLPMEGDGEDFR